MGSLDLRLATMAEGKEILKLAGKWFGRARSKFKDNQSTARHAVAEYIANTSGLTLYKSRQTPVSGERDAWGKRY